MEKQINSRPFKIILADDDFDDFRLVKDIIEKFELNVHVSHVEDGQYLIDILKAQGTNNKFGDLPHLILLDLNMPRKNGLEVLKEIKANNHLRKIPVIIFTTSTSPRDIEQSYESGASCYVTKPNTAEDWENTLSNLIRFWRLNVIVPMSI